MLGNDLATRGLSASYDLGLRLRSQAPQFAGLSLRRSASSSWLTRSTTLDIDKYLSIDDNSPLVGRQQARRSKEGALEPVSTARVRDPVTTARARVPSAPYSAAMIANGFVFVSGQRPVDPETGLIPEGVRAQTRQVIANINAVLEAAGATLGDVVKVTAHLADLALFDEFNAAYLEGFQPPYPARTTVGSQLRGILVELDAIAAKDATRSN
jgi:2-iminobutanoate/2-iminopropanoate deaminase